jgi:hypothetical protein
MRELAPTLVLKNCPRVSNHLSAPKEIKNLAGSNPTKIVRYSASPVRIYSASTVRIYNATSSLCSTFWKQWSLSRENSVFGEFIDNCVIWYFVMESKPSFFYNRWQKIGEMVKITMYRLSDHNLDPPPSSFFLIVRLGQLSYIQVPEVQQQDLLQNLGSAHTRQRTALAKGNQGPILRILNLQLQRQRCNRLR